MRQVVLLFLIRIVSGSSTPGVPKPMADGVDPASRDMLSTSWRTCERM